ncbi:glyoxalase [Marinomonas agarivorans]|nr:glyoxalase [Marinomonas agarivorans]
MQLITSYYPVIMVADVQKVKAFFEQYLDFEVVYDSDWYVHLGMKDQGNVNLAFVRYDHGSVPASYRKASQGVLLNFEVENVDSEYARLKDQVDTALELKQEDWGQKHFIIEAPEGILIDIIQLIPPTEEFKNSYL